MLAILIAFLLALFLISVNVALGLDITVESEIKDVMRSHLLLSYS